VGWPSRTRTTGSWNSPPVLEPGGAASSMVTLELRSARGERFHARLDDANIDEKMVMASVTKKGSPCSRKERPGMSNVTN